MAGTHSLWSPSSAKRWRSCTGSVVMNDGVRETASKYAAEGTAYHAVSEDTIRGKYSRCVDAVGEVREADGFKFTITEDDADYAQEYVDRIQARMREGAIVQVEVKQDTSEVLGIPGQTGTVDAAVMQIVEETYEINDLKFGAGVRVYAREPDGKPNDQLFTYGWSGMMRTLFMCDWKWLRLRVHQPRLGHYDEITLSREECEKLGADLLRDAQRSYETWQRFREDATGLQTYLTPSLEACRWCAVAGRCKARAQKMLTWFPTREQIKYMVEVPLTAKNLPVMSDAELAVCLDRAEEIEQWIRSVRAEATGRAESGSKIPGWKLTEGRKGDRTANPDDIRRRAVDVVKNDPNLSPLGLYDGLPKELYTEPELKSVAQLEKACKRLGDLGKKIWMHIAGHPGDEKKGIPPIPSLITQAAGRPTLVRDFDARPELTIQPVTMELRPVGQEFSAAQHSDAAAGLM